MYIVQAYQFLFHYTVFPARHFTTLHVRVKCTSQIACWSCENAFLEDILAIYTLLQGDGSWESKSAHKPVITISNEILTVPENTVQDVAKVFLKDLFDWWDERKFCFYRITANITKWYIKDIEEIQRFSLHAYCLQSLVYKV